ncbi:MAG TPA: mechanosensitive ion channel [Thermoanaerobaculia bacterium]|nr:mechanosensitive ion channel [Thermoanaerobaculia bacterium]
MPFDWDRITNDFGAFVPNLLMALAVLIAGWLIALLVAAGVRALLARTGLDDRLASKLAQDQEGPPPNVGRLVSRIVFWLLMLVAVVAFFQMLGLGLAAGPLSRLTNSIFGYLPHLLSAVLLLVVAWISARLARFLVRRSAEAAGIDERIAHRAAGRQPAYRLSRALAETAYWLVLLLFIPAILDALDLGSLTQSVNAMVESVLLAVPRLFAAAAVVLLAVLIGRVVAGFVANLLAAFGFDRLLERLGLVRGLSADPTAPGASLAASPSVRERAETEAAAEAEAEAEEPMPDLISRRRTPSEAVGFVTQVAIVLFATVEALFLLQFDAVAMMVQEFLFFAGDLLLALLVLMLGLYLARLAADAIRGSHLEQSDFLARVAQGAIVVLSAAMALRQAGVAEDIVLLSFGLLLGALAVAAAIAFGIGGRDLAARSLERWTEHAAQRVKRPRTAPPADASGPGAGAGSADRRGPDDPGVGSPGGPVL